MSTQDRFVTLDGMRGLAALVVAGSHIGELLHIGKSPHTHLAVDFFFVLSGFVLAHAYEERLATAMRPLEFVCRRVIRLHPLILLGSAIAAVRLFASSLAGPGDTVSSILWSLVAGSLMIPATDPTWPAFPLDGPAWSLFAEYAVNIVFAVIAASLTPARLRAILFMGMALLLFLAAGDRGLESYWRADTVGLSLLRVIYPFFAGVLISRIHRTGQTPVPRISYRLSLAVLLVILLAPGTRFDALFDLVMIIAVFPLLVFASASDALTPAENKWMLLSGRLSYPIYILHYPLAGWLVPAAALVLPTKGVLAVIMLLVIAASYLVLRCYDEPVRAWLSARVQVRAKRALAA